MSSPLLAARALRKLYPARGPGGRGAAVAAVDGVDLELARGGSLAVVGESGAGKSTLVRLLLALERPTAGRVELDGVDLNAVGARRLRQLRRRFQPVFQDPTGSLNPKLKVRTLVAEPLLAHGIGSAAEQRRRVAELLEQVELPASAAERRPAAFSAGERQRIAIARALAPAPELLLLDEPVASLDASIRGSILALIDRLRHGMGLAVLLVSHDLAVVDRLCDEVAVMYRGRIVEHGATAVVLEDPCHPYTVDLLAAAPKADPEWRPPPRPPVDPLGGNGGCPYQPRCARRNSRCSSAPSLNEVSAGRRVACWLHRD